MTTITFPQGFLAINPAASYAPAKDADGQFFLRTDTARTSPLTILDVTTGTALAGKTIRSDSNGIVPPCSVTVDVSSPDDLVLVWKSSDLEVPVQSVTSVITYLEPKLDQAVADAQSAQTSAQQAVGTVNGLSTDVQNGLAALTSNNNGGVVTDPPRTDPTILVHGSDAQWASEAYVLVAGQPGWATDTKVLKVGDGTRVWADLPTIAGGSGGAVSAADITDSTTTGRALIRASSADDAAGVLALGWLHTGAGAPAIAAPPGSVYARTDGGSNTSLYVKETGSGSSGWVAYGAAQTKAALGLGNVDNTSDLAKPISTATQAELDRRTVDYWADSSGHWPTLNSADLHRRLYSTHTATADVPTDPMLNVGDLWYAHPDQAV